MIEQRSQSTVFGSLAGELASCGKYFRFSAAGRSMPPTILDGDILHVEPIASPPGIGDIVLFCKGGEFKAHRIVGKAGNYFVSRGDAGMETDGAMRIEEIVGRVVAREHAETGQVRSLNGIRPRMPYFALALRRAFRARLFLPILQRFCLLLVIELIL